ncbi:hypothetical protein H9638_06015 [Arthrobacter sp. Sa2BUA2]|uniref:Uncharacterized protein n=2 Tax=Arthrobacter pullicola TaxID=2762224 RepID=A0ABR8YGM0_9MICC|nr:hypothetical protein [Arthrobacter pullicola]
MGTFLLRLLLTFNATSLLVVIYQVKEPFLFLQFGDGIRYGLSVALIMVPILFTSLGILLSRTLGRDAIEAGSIASIEHASNVFLPSYLGYFFVALSIPDIRTLLFVYAVLFAFTFMSQALYFNPLFLLFGYRFYNMVTSEGTSIFVISRQDFRTPASVEVRPVRRINGYTFMESK